MVLEQQFDSWQRGVRRISFRVFAGFCLAVAALQTRSLLVGIHHDGLPVGVTAATIVVLLVVAARGWRGHLDAVDVGGLTLLLAVAAATSDALRDPAATGGDGNPVFLILATTLLLHIVVLRGLAVLVGVTGVTAVYVAASVLLGGRELTAALDESILMATTQLAIWLVLRELEREADRADRAHQSAIEQQAEAARRTSEHGHSLRTRRTWARSVVRRLALVVQSTTGRALHPV